MTIGEPEPEPELNHTPDHILDWLEGSIAYLPSFLDDPYDSRCDINYDSWWIQDPDLDQDPINYNSTSFNPSTSTTPTSTTLTEPAIPIQPQPSDSSRKRKSLSEPIPKASKNNRRIKETTNTVVQPKKTSGAKRGNAKSTLNSGHNGNHKEGRWAEQLLNPCATAITTGNLMRVQHLVYVLHELASPTGDANHRLASHGLKALTQHLSPSSLPNISINFSSSKPKFFQDSLINFNNINPWFTIPNDIANSSILQIISQQEPIKNLHILDIGVSHGVQWPLLLEALARRPGGPPQLVKLTVISPITPSTPFSNGPQGYNYTTQLLKYANSININLQINQIQNHPLQNLNSQLINSSPNETLIICSQFRLHTLNHDDKTQFLKSLMGMNPKGVILSENILDCTCTNCVDYAAGFSIKVDYLWSFLDSTSVAYKGRESEERRMMEGEAAKVLMNEGVMNERKEKWCDRMKQVGFIEGVFGEDTIDGGRALLRKYDNNWEMRVEERHGCVGLWWKGTQVSFCSLWRIDDQSNES